MAKIYRYKSKLYCDEELTDTDSYAGDIYDLYSDLRANRLVGEQTVYYVEGEDGETYSEPEELIEHEFDSLGVICMGEA